MAKNAYQLQVDYEKSKAVIAELKDVAGNMQKQINNLQDVYNSIGSSWKSDSTPEYKKKLQKRINELTDLLKKLNTIIEQTQTVAKNTYDSEMRAINIINTKGGSGGGGNHGGGGRSF